MKKTVALTISAVTSIAALMPSQSALAAACTAGTATASMVCTQVSGGQLNTAFDMTGSVGVQINYTAGVSGFGACAGHIGGTQNYGLSTEGGSMQVLTGSSAAGLQQPSTSATGRGCT